MDTPKLRSPNTVPSVSATSSNTATPASGVRSWRSSRSVTVPASCTYWWASYHTGDIRTAEEFHQLGPT